MLFYLYFSSKLTELPHIAGSDRNRDLAMDIYREWKTFGFDSVEVINYTVLLSYPNGDDPSSLVLKDSNGSIIYASHIAEEPSLTDNEKKNDIVAPFNAYSGNGTVTVRIIIICVYFLMMCLIIRGLQGGREKQ